jgi:hypothetical protein
LPAKPAEVESMIAVMAASTAAARSVRERLGASAMLGASTSSDACGIPHRRDAAFLPTARGLVGGTRSRFTVEPRVVGDRLQVGARMCRGGSRPLDSTENSEQKSIWGGVERLIDAAPGLRDLQAHGLHLLAARRYRSLGTPVPPDLVRADPDAAQAALIAAGFEPVASRLHPETTHHLHPLQLPGVPLSVELHRHPKWIDGLRTPSLDELLDGSEAAALGVKGILTLKPAYHALVLAAHLWAHDPLARLLRFVDVAVMAEAAELRELERLVDAWGLERPWRMTTGVADALFHGSDEPLPLRLWARNLRTAREATVLEMHVARCLAPFSVLPTRRAVRAAGRALAGVLRPQPYESWRGKLRRTAQQLRRPSMRRSEHARGVGANLVEPESTLEPRPHRGAPSDGAR